MLKNVEGIETDKNWQEILRLMNILKKISKLLEKHQNTYVQTNILL